MRQQGRYLSRVPIAAPTPCKRGPHHVGNRDPPAPAEGIVGIPFWLFVAENHLADGLRLALRGHLHPKPTQSHRSAVWAIATQQQQKRSDLAHWSCGTTRKLPVFKFCAVVG
jgi:hypothetical protein